MDGVVELLDRAAAHGHVLAALEADTGVVSAHDRVAVDRVAVEVERDAIGADDEAVGGAVAQVLSQGEAVGDRGAAGGAGSEGRGDRCQADGERDSDNWQCQRSGQ